MAVDIYSEIPTTDQNLRQAMYKVFKGKCFYTGQLVTLETMEIDHIIPKSKGGKDCISNYVLTNRPVNGYKRDKVNTEFAEGTVYYNSITYAPKVLKIYNKQHSTNKRGPKPKGETARTSKDYQFLAFIKSEVVKIFINLSPDKRTELLSEWYKLAKDQTND